MLIQLLWLLHGSEVPKDCIKAFFGKFENIDSYPLVAPGKGAYKIPPPYDDPRCLDWTFQGLATLIGNAIALACGREAIGTIVLVYANHGTPKGLEAGYGFLRQLDFTQWATQCTNSEKKFLVVLDACCSTVFATATMDHINRQLEQKHQTSKVPWIAANVGFITSATGICGRSTPMISRDATLVNLFGATPPSAAWASGFFTRSSMFLRQFNWLLTYGFETLHSKLTVREFVQRMNRRRFPAGHGFHAALVGGDGFASSEFKSFFKIRPLGVPDPAVPLPGWEELTVGDLIPALRLGRLYDDWGHLEEEEGEGEETDPVKEEELKEEEADSPLIPIHKVDGVVRRASPVLLSSAANLGPVFMAKLCIRDSPAEDD
jgi:hypothetical protein